ncbi:hypothetical protein J8L85_13455 [Maribacter sp. MMG018]|uniref:hypothetical protein n=1 Tax=Maribacter sp. MMG018 TaxID=2822688 RepID=UPI001B374746|nr:hypothetical protein [Maribacter sp. MMG018]MBQ4915455.1 hypothetical protein [Maribacter sp. MMG018]
MKKIFNRENLLILLVVGLIGHNVYLQTRVEKAIDAAQDAEYEASRAANNADDAASYARNAADYASEASDNAANAWYSAQDAANNAFGNECWSCP